MDSKEPLVGIVMGSDSDWPLVQKACATLDGFGVPYETRVISAHRTPDVALEYSKTAESRGIKVIIAAAGGAAHLGGVLAAGTVLPVIGIPVAGGALNGLDALYATVQMPSGVPVATVAVGSAGPANAALLAVQILGTADAALREKFRHAWRHEVVDWFAREQAAADLGGGFARARIRHERAFPAQQIPVLPEVQACHVVFPDDVEDRRAGETRLSGQHRVNRIRRAWRLADLEVPRLKARVQAGDEPHELPAPVVRKPARHLAAPRLERVDLRGHEQQPVERQLLHGPPGDAQVAGMDGIEAPAEDADSLHGEKYTINGGN